MIIGRIDRQRIERLKTYIAVQDEELKHLEEVIRIQRDRILELEGELENKDLALSCVTYRENGTCRGCMHEECCLLYTE